MNTGQDVMNYIKIFRNAGQLPMITMDDVARQAQISGATVSRVLNANGPVSADTERRVRQTIQQLG